MRAEVQAAVEELRGLRAAEESALTALADEELAARFNGDVTLTVRDDAVTVLSPEQVIYRPGFLYTSLCTLVCCDTGLYALMLAEQAF